MPRCARPSHQKYDVAVRTSAIDGRGVFAAEAIPARLKIGEMRGESITRAEGRRRAAVRASVSIVDISDRRAIDASVSTDAMRLTNHSCAPNARMIVRTGRIEFYAVRDIAPGDEITVDYETSHHAGTRPCTCGAPTCRGWL